MNVVLSPNLFCIPHAYPLSQNDLPFFFSEKKKNIIVDGTFTKIMYSTEYFTMNGLYVSFRVCDIQGHLRKDAGANNERRGTSYSQNATTGACSELRKDAGANNERRGTSYSQNATTGACSELSCSQIKTFAPPPNIESPLGKNYIHYDPLLEYNRLQIESLCQLEYHILEMYAVANEIHLYKKPVYYLKTQIQYGMIKAQCENSGERFAQEPRRDNVRSLVVVRGLHQNAEARNERRCSGYSRIAQEPRRDDVRSLVVVRGFTGEDSSSQVNATIGACSEFTGEDSSSQVNVRPVGPEDCVRTPERTTSEGVRAIHGMRQQEHAVNCVRTPERTTSEGVRAIHGMRQQEHSVNSFPTNTPQSPPQRWTKYIQISGVWEADLYYGITYKIICENTEARKHRGDELA